MTTINDKMGLRRAGKRSMMSNLPKTRAAAAMITAAQCPACQVRGKAKPSATQPGQLYCTWCHHVFELSGGAPSE
jgi:hypothetical protein